MARGREALIFLTVLLSLSIFILIPEQGRVALGIELLAGSIIVFVVALRLQAGTLRRLPRPRRRSWIIRLIVINSATFAITAAGAGLLTERFGGMLWLVPTVFTGLLWSTYNAWSLTIATSEKHLSQ